MRIFRLLTIFFLSLALRVPVFAEAQLLSVDAPATLKELLAQEDTDHDGVITVRDQGPKRFLIPSPGQASFEVAGVYPLSNLLEELTRAERSHELSIQLSSATLYAPIPERLSQLIQRDYWPQLVRRLDDAGIRQALHDDKVPSDGTNRIYVPKDDAEAQTYYKKLAARLPDLHLQVIPLERNATVPDHAPGLLSLAFDRKGKPLPFVVPGGRFNELYGWDSYFIVLGLLHEGRRDLAQNIVDHFVYEIRHYGKILNANRSYYLTRSQPPFLTAMVLAIYKSDPTAKDARTNLTQGLEAAIDDYQTVWSTGPHLTSTGLARYWDSGSGIPIEASTGSFDGVLALYANGAKLPIREYETKYKNHQIQNSALDAYFTHDRAMRESGHDSSVRLRAHAADLNPVDLNALLYRYESDIAETIQQAFGDHLVLPNGKIETSASWFKRAEDRKNLMTRYLWDGSRGLFEDYDFVKHERHGYIGATTFYPLWAGSADKSQADSLVHNALPLLESAGGLLAGTADSRGAVTAAAPQGQWDYPFGWAPHQMLLWQGLNRYGFNSEVRRLAYRWLYTVFINASEGNGVVVEHYDVINRSASRQAEYGNEGLKFRGLSDGGFGWTNASIETGLDYLTSAQHAALDRLVPPEWLSASVNETDATTQQVNFTGNSGKAVAVSHWKNTADLSFVDTTGNSRSQTTSVRELLVYKNDPYQLGILLRGLGAEAAGVPSAEQYEANEKLDYKISAREYLFEKIGWAKDRFAGIQNHYEGTAGLGQHWIDTPKNKWNGEFGAGYVYEDRINSPLDRFPALRGFSVVSHYFTSASFFSQSVEWLVNATDGPDFRVKSDSAITAMITTHLALKLDYVISHVNHPPIGAVADDTITSVSLSVRY